MPTKKVVLKIPLQPRARRPAKFVGDSESGTSSNSEMSDLEDDSLDEGDGDEDDELELEEEEDDQDQDQEMEDDEEVDDSGDVGESDREQLTSELEADYAEAESYDDSGMVDPGKLTARQRLKLDNEKLPMAMPDMTVFDNPSSRKKTVLSAEEQRIKRAELARRRKNLSERRLEEEKQDTLDRLLKKRTGRTKKEDSEEFRTATMSRLVAPHPALRSWTSSARGETFSFTSSS